ncbi:hypothetical protein ANN_14722 [Periplaneta americana]|uniref:PiggyBac transposable element-derived protein domain-containing protein n=1 Tax=Periplaneta americana TaxID=6978 RepID=A0ABQ8SYA9_PERAM|nr:hypothetical protein ANN_14722 [Periplaneta americana]
MFAFDNELVLLSYVPKKGKYVLLLSNMHQGASVSESGLPEIIEFYNSTKGGVDMFDQMCSTYSCNRKTQRWPLCVFYGIINSSCLNAYVILRHNMTTVGAHVQPREMFLLSLGEAMMTPWMEKRLVMQNLPRLIRENIADQLGKNVPETSTTLQGEGAKRRCHLCPRSKDRKSKIQWRLNIVPEDALFHKNEHFLNVTKILKFLRNREFDIWCRHPQKEKGVVLFKQYPGANKWICKHEGLSNSEWRDGIKMVGNVAAVRAVPERSQDNRCRHFHNEVETLAHVLGSCPHGEALRNTRHHQVRSIIATALKHADYNTFEEVHGLSVTGSTRRIDIIAFKESTRSGYIIDPTVRFETDEEQPAEVDNEKKEYLQSYHSLLPQKNTG